MRPSDRKEFAQLVTDVHAYHRMDASKFVLDIWWVACEPFEMEQIRAAITRHVTDPESGKYLPKVADVVRQLMGTRTERSMLAWGKVYEAMGRVGAYTDVVFDDPAIHAVIEDLGGWPKVCRHPSDELSYLQHRFCESHKAYTQATGHVYPRRLMGDRSPDSEYTKKGLPPPAPVIVGDVDAARAVYRSGTLAGKATLTQLAASATGGLKLGAPS